MGEGEPVLLVHGVCTDSGDWLPLVPYLRDRFTVVTMDRRGRGRSGDAAEHAMEREAQDVLAVLEAVGAERLVGHSYGALLSILAAQRADRLRALVLYEPPIGVREEALADLDATVESGDLDGALATFLAAAGTTPEQLELIRASRAWPALREAVPPLPRELHAAARWQSPPGPIDVPTLFLMGADTTSGSYLDGLDDLHAAFPNRREELLPGQKHVAHVFAAEDFAKLVGGFLEQNY